MWVVKHATSLFNSFCSNVANKVARFCCPFYRTLRFRAINISFDFVRPFDKMAWSVVSQISF